MRGDLLTGRTTTRLATGERRERLLESARAEFVENGFSGAKTRAIATAAGTTETMMYRLFASKEALFDEAVCDPLEELILQMAALAPKFRTTDADSRAWLDPRAQEQLLELMIEAVPLFGAAILNQETGPVFFQRRIAPLIDLSVKAIAKMLRSFPNTDIEPEVLYLAIFGMHLGLAIEATRTDADFDVEAMAAGVVNVLTRGLSGS